MPVGGGVELPPPQPIACSSKNRTNTAKGSAPTRRWRLVRAKNKRTMASNNASSRSRIRCGRKYNRSVGNDGGAMPWAMVVTLTLAVPLPLASMFGLTVQVVVEVTEAGKEQDKLTCEAKPFCAVTVIELVKLAVWPALTVCVVVPVEVMVKSGVGVKVKFKTLMPPKATGLGSGGPKELTIMK